MNYIWNYAFLNFKKVLDKELYLTSPGEGKETIKKDLDKELYLTSPQDLYLTSPKELYSELRLSLALPCW